MWIPRRVQLGLSLCAALHLAVGLDLTSGQEVEVRAQGRIAKPSPPPVQATSQPAQPGQPAPGQPMPMPGANPAAATPAAAAAPMPPAAVTRGTKPDFVADPKEFDVRPNPDGALKISFRGQPWPAVLEWLSRVSGVSLDWQELPGDYLNLVTQQEYTVPETQDLINRHLLARGYTLLRRGETMTVENIKKLDPSLVPRVRPSELRDLPDHEYVKASFPLRWILADDAVEELKPMLSPNGKISALKHTNRVEVMDAVVNLREVWDMLEEEQDPGTSESLVRPFKLVHVRAEDIIDNLKELLGIKTNNPMAAMNPQQMQQMQQMMMQQAQQQAQQQGGKAPKKEAEVRLVAIARDNIILVDAPPDQMAKVAEAIDILDQPTGSGLNPFDAIEQTQIYRLHNLDPKSFLETLNRVGGLSPRTTVQVDEVNRAIVVSGPRADQVLVDLLVKKLDGNARQFQVIQLRKLPAEFVAGSIRFMMGKEAEEGRQQPRRSFYFDPFGGYGRQQDDKKPDDFRVDADTEQNRLLLWCNDIELRDVEELLVKLGELPMPGGNQNRRRVYEADSLEDAVRLLERLQRAWPTHGKNPLKIEVPPVESKEESDQPAPSELSPDKVEPPKRPGNREARVAPPTAASVSLPDAGSVEAIASVTAAKWIPVSNPAPVSKEQATSKEKTEAQADPAAPTSGQQPSADNPDDQIRKLLDDVRRQRESKATADSSEPAPIRLRVGVDGRIHIESDDPAALDLMEDLLDEFAPPQKDWKVFKLKYPTTWAYGIELNLKDLFKEEMEGEKRGSGVEYDPYFGFMPSTGKTTGPRRLSRRKPLKIISDRDTQTILVQGATQEQLYMIEEIIDIYDQPVSTEGHAVRKTQIFQLKYAKARPVESAIKDVYRDLLSDNDKALQENKGGNKKDERPSAAPSYTYIYGSRGSGGEAGGEKEEQPVKFKGLLSTGVDEISNIVIVSATEGLLNNVGQIIEALDEAARPNASVRVVQLDSRVNAKILQQKLHSILGPKPAPQQGKQGQQPNGQPGQPNAAQAQPNVQVAE